MSDDHLPNFITFPFVILLLHLHCDLRGQCFGRITVLHLVTVHRRTLRPEVLLPVYMRLFVAWESAVELSLLACSGVAQSLHSVPVVVVFDGERGVPLDEKD